MTRARRVPRDGQHLRVLITNCVVQNGGDAAILQSLISTLLAVAGDDTEVIVVDDQPEAGAKLMPELTFRPRVDKTFSPAKRLRRFDRLRRAQQRARVIGAAWLMGRGYERLALGLVRRSQIDALREFHACDAVISTGGTYLVERYSQIDARLLELEVALAMGRPLILFTQSLGPFTEPSLRKAIRRILGRASLVLLRDERSLHHLHDIGLSGASLKVSPDGVFALPLREPTNSLPVRRVAISVRDWPYGGDGANASYRRAIADLASTLVSDLGTHVTFISTCQGVPSYTTDDSAVALEIAHHLAASVRSAVTVDRAFRTPQALIEELATFDLVVATRMHMAILSLVAGTPVFPIAYESKTLELFNQLGFGDRVYDFSNVSDQSFVPDVLRFIDDLPAIAPELWAAVHREHDLAAQSGHDLCVALDSARSQLELAAWRKASRYARQRLIGACRWTRR